MNDRSTTGVVLTPLSRRRFLGLGGAAVAGAGLALVGCGSDASTTSPTSGATAATDAATATTSAATTATDAATETTAVATTLSTGTPATTVFTAADFSSLGACVLLPDLTQGPYPTVTQIERRDITEGLGGHPLRVGVQVVDGTCTPIPDAMVEIWHCDVDGDYSAYADGYTDDDAGPGTTFFRGSQTANDEGIVEFLTSYPGWYTGRAVHIHAKVHIDEATVLTTQFFFEDDLNTEIFSTEAAYAGHGEPDTTNETDNIAGGDPESAGTLLTVSDDAEISGSRALIVVGLDPTATSSGASGGGMGGGMGTPPGGTPPAAP